MSSVLLDFMVSKPWYTSKTVWLAILQAVAGIITALIANDPHLQMIGGIALIKSGIDLAIRMLTAKAIN